MSKLFDDIFAKLGDDKDLRNHLSAFLRKARAYKDVVEEEKEYERHKNGYKEALKNGIEEKEPEVSEKNKKGRVGYSFNWLKKKHDAIKKAEKENKEKSLYEEAQEGWVTTYDVKNGKLARAVRKMTNAEKEMFKETFNEMNEDFDKTMKELENEFKGFMEGFISEVTPKGVKIAGSKHRWPFSMLHVF